MRVLVTGAKGQVGSELILEGKKRGINMLATGRVELDRARRKRATVASVSDGAFAGSTLAAD